MANQGRIYASLLATYGKQIELAFREAVARAATAVDLSELAQAIDRGDIGTAARLVQLDENRLFVVTETVRGAFVAGGASTIEILPRARQGSFAFSGRHIRAESWIASHSRKFVREISDQAFAMVRAVVEDNVARGLGSRRAALDITGRMNPITKRRQGGFIGLTENQTQYVTNARRQLQNLDAGYLDRALRDKRFDAQVRSAIRDGMPLSKETVDRLTNRYHDRMLAHRGKVIGQDQAHTAISTGRHEGFNQLRENPNVSEVTKRWQWNFSNDPREDHRAMASAPARPFDMPFVFEDGTSMQMPHEDGAPPKHKLGCKCIVFYRPRFV